MVQMWDVSDLGWWQMGEFTKTLCYLSTGYSEESGEEGEEVKDDSEVLSLSLRMRVPLHAMTKSRWHLTWGKIVYCLL